VIARAFDEADRRDPRHRRTWVARVDGNSHQIQRIKYEAKRRRVKVTIICDFVQVLQYRRNVAGYLYPDGSLTAEQWAHEQATRVLEGHATKVAGQIRRQATKRPDGFRSAQPADGAVNYFTHLAPYLDSPNRPQPRLADPYRDRQAPAVDSSKTGRTSPPPAGDSPAPKPSSSYAR